MGKVTDTSRRFGSGNPDISFDSVDDLKNATGLETGWKVRTLGYYEPGDGGGNDYEIVAAWSGTDDGGSFIDLSGSGLQARGIFRTYATSKQFGCVADGVIDDSLGIQSLLDSDAANDKRITGGVHRINSGVIISSPECALSTEKGSKIKCGAVDIACVTVESDFVTVSVEIDGDNIAHSGISVPVGVLGTTVVGCKIYNIYSETRQCFGIVVRSGSGSIIKGNVIKDIGSLGDGAIGNGNGMARGIQYLPAVIPTGLTIISDNVIENIYGEEGGGISVQNTPNEWDGVYPYPDGRVVLTGNTIENFSRRGIKIQSSGVFCGSNKIITSVEPTTGTKSYAIALYASDDCSIVGNYLNLNHIYSAITLQGVSSEYSSRNITCSYNVISSPRDDVVIFMTWIEDSCFSSNHIIGVPANSRVIAVGGASGIIIDGNRLSTGDSTADLIEVVSSASNVYVTNNTVQGVSALRFLKIYGSNVIVINNTSIDTTYSSVPIRGYDPSAAGSVVRNNSFINSGQTTAAFFNGMNFEDFGNIATT